MHNAKSQGELAPEQYGSHISKAAGTLCLNKWLFYDNIRAMIIPVTLCSSNIKSCYNWIALLIVALCLCHLGVPVKAMESMIAMLAQLHHHVQSAFGN